MKNKIRLIFMALVMVLALMPVDSAQAYKSKKLHLDDHQVVGGGDPNMFGEATIDVNAGRGQVCYWLRVFIYPGSGDWPPTSTAIYKAPPGQNGPLVVDLNPPWGPKSQDTISGCVSIDKQLAHDISRRPREYYLQLADESYPDGAARAQLIR
jgi:hypothetical protein